MKNSAGLAIRFPAASEIGPGSFIAKLAGWLRDRRGLRAVPSGLTVAAPRETAGAAGPILLGADPAEALLWEMILAGIDPACPRIFSVDTLPDLKEWLVKKPANSEGLPKNLSTASCGPVRMRFEPDNLRAHCKGFADLSTGRTTVGGYRVMSYALEGAVLKLNGVIQSEDYGMTVDLQRFIDRESGILFVDAGGVRSVNSTILQILDAAREHLRQSGHDLLLIDSSTGFQQNMRRAGIRFSSIRNGRSALFPMRGG